ncbi:hypothetical protein BDZ89DRAFT_1040678 [Hymenopellis radicata]|nr:hypothetical protein BDZ89DRAFT_1040678 [Hymenopellis radicata]
MHYGNVDKHTLDEFFSHSQRKFTSERVGSSHEPRLSRVATEVEYRREVHILGVSYVLKNTASLSASTDGGKCKHCINRSRRDTTIDDNRLINGIAHRDRDLGRGTIDDAFKDGDAQEDRISKISPKGSDCEDEIFQFCVNTFTAAVLSNVRMSGVVSQHVLSAAICDWPLGAPDKDLVFGSSTVRTGYGLPKLVSISPKKNWPAPTFGQKNSRTAFPPIFGVLAQGRESVPEKGKGGAGPGRVRHRRTVTVGGGGVHGKARIHMLRDSNESARKSNAQKREQWEDCRVKDAWSKGKAWSEGKTGAGSINAGE